MRVTGAGDDKAALLLVFEPRLQTDAVRPDLDVVPGREVGVGCADGLEGGAAVGRQPKAAA
jgi:hypothetical protein